MSSNKLQFIPLAQNGTQSTILNAIRDYAQISRSRIADLRKLPNAAVTRSTSMIPPYVATLPHRLARPRNAIPEATFHE